jgi:hypothetical protein
MRSGEASRLAFVAIIAHRGSLFGLSCFDSLWRLQRLPCSRGFAASMRAKLRPCAAQSCDAPALTLTAVTGYGPNTCGSC